MQVSIALSLLTAAVAKPPFNQLICTFSSRPELHLVKGDTLVEQVAVSGAHQGSTLRAKMVLVLCRSNAYLATPGQLTVQILLTQKPEQPCHVCAGARCVRNGLGGQHRPQRRLRSHLEGEVLLRAGVYHGDLQAMAFIVVLYVPCFPCVGNGVALPGQQLPTMS